jgi:hypothetical protein
VLSIVLWGCTEDHFFSSYDSSCITPDGSTIGIIVRDASRLLLNAKTGEVHKREKRGSEKEGDVGNPGHLICSEENKVFAVYPKKIINLADGSERRCDGGRPIGFIGRDTLISYGGGRMSANSTGRREEGAPLRTPGWYRGKPLDLYIEKPGQNPEKKK